jgi:hypothetical protein
MRHLFAHFISTSCILAKNVTLSSSVRIFSLNQAMSSALGGNAGSGEKGSGERNGVMSIKAPKTQKGGQTVNLMSLRRGQRESEERTEPKLEKKHG